MANILENKAKRGGGEKTKTIKPKQAKVVSQNGRQLRKTSQSKFVDTDIKG